MSYLHSLLYTPGMNGFFSAYYDMLIVAGVIAAFIIAIPLMLLGSLFSFLLDHWKIVLGIAVIIGWIIYAGDKKKDDTKSTDTDMDTKNDIIPPNKDTVDLSTVGPRGNEIEKYCGNCGSKVTGKGNFCGNCGKKVE